VYLLGRVFVQVFLPGFFAWIFCPGFLHGFVQASLCRFVDAGLYGWPGEQVQAGICLSFCGFFLPGFSAQVFCAGQQVQACICVGLC